MTVPVRDSVPVLEETSVVVVDKTSEVVTGGAELAPVEGVADDSGGEVVEPSVETAGVDVIEADDSTPGAVLGGVVLMAVLEGVTSGGMTAGVVLSMIG